MRENKLPKFAPISFARRLRANQTPEETKLWYLLRDRRFSEFKFRRQKIIGKYIADFVCMSRKLIVEADGAHHDVDADAPRDAYLRSLGFRVLRFGNFDINRNIEFVSENIFQALNDWKFDPQKPSLSLQGEDDLLKDGAQ